MRTRATLFAVILLAACNSESTTAPGSAARLAPPAVVGVPVTLAAASSGDTPVTSTLADAGMQIRSDGLGAYRNASTLTSVIQSIGAWVLDSYNPRKSTRQVYLDFSRPVAGSGPNGGNPVAIPSGLYKVRIIVNCPLYNNSNMLTLAPGATMLCPFHVGDIYSGGAGYAIEMNPVHTTTGTSYPETNSANVTCVRPASGAGPCTGWTITPSVTGGNVGVILNNGVSQGDYTFSFSVGITNP
jgi:hypothetical protein